MTGRFLLRLIRFRAKTFAAIAGIWIVVFAVPLITGLVLRAVFDALTGDRPAGLDVWTLIALVVTLEGVGRGVTYARVLLENSMQFNVGALLRTNMLEHVLARPGADHLPEPTGELVNRFRDDAGEVMGYIWMPAILVGQGLFALVAVFVMARIHAPMTLVMLVPLLFVVVIAQIATARMQNYRRASRVATGDVTGFLGEIFGSVQAIQVAGAERHVTEHFERLSEHRRRDSVRDRVFNQFLDSLWWNSSSLSLGVMLLLAAHVMRTGEFTVGDFALFAYYLDWLRTIPMLVGTLIARYRHAGVALERLGRVVDPAPADAVAAHRPIYVDREPPPLEPASRANVPPLELLEARGLTYRHPSGRGVEGVDLRLPRSSFTVVTGRVGAGKTTLLRALLGLLRLQEGEVLWNGRRIDDPASFLVPPRAAYVPQAPRLFSTTIRDNVLLGLSTGDRELERAVSAAVLDADVAAFPDALATVVGPRGVRLSGGQMQRVAAARMFVRRADLIVLDDLSSALDVDTENEVWDRLFEATAGAATVLVVTHRPAVIARADQVLELGRPAVPDPGAPRSAAL